MTTPETTAAEQPPANLVLDGIAAARELAAAPCPACMSRRCIVITADETGAMAWAGVTPHEADCPAGGRP